MIWQPLNLTASCLPNSELTACSPFGYVFLNLLVQLYGGPVKYKQEKKHEYCHGDTSEKEVHQEFKEDARPTNYKKFEPFYRVTKEETRKNEFNDSFGDGVEIHDFIIVGAGSAGCVLANRLSEVEDWKILLLEAGGEQPEVSLIPSLFYTMQGSSVDWQFTAESNGRSCLARDGRKCVWPRGKMMGGSSSINTMLYIRGVKADYDGWAALGNEGWSYEEVLPYFMKSEKNLDIKFREYEDEKQKPFLDAIDPNYHGVDGEISVSFYPHREKIELMPVKAFIEKGLPVTDFNRPTNYGTGNAQSINKHGVRTSSNQAFILPIKHKRKNLTIRTHCEVMVVLVDSNSKAFGVLYIKNGEMRTVFARKEVILSAGTINSAKILLLSGIGPKEHLNDVNIPVIKDLPVGRNLHDHVTFEGIIIALPNETNTAISNEELLKKMNDYDEMEVKRGPLTEVGPASSIVFFKTNPNLSDPDIEILFYSMFNWREHLRDPLQYDKVNIFPTVFYDAFSPRVHLLAPKSRGMLLLNATNILGPPIIYPNYFGNPSDLAVIVKGTRLVYELEDTRAFKSSGAYFIKEPMPHCKDFKWGTDSYSKCLAMNYNAGPSHTAGTCKMGPLSDKTAVVDPRLRVYGIRNLRVIDCSIMPQVNRGHTHAPATMIGEKGADMIKEDWLRSRSIISRK